MDTSVMLEFAPRLDVDESGVFLRNWRMGASGDCSSQSGAS
jgi:hypothetical protein